MEIVKYLVEERKIPEAVKASCVTTAAKYGHLDCINYLVDEAESASYLLAIHRLRSVLRAPRVRKLLAHKRVSGTNGRRIREICREEARRRRTTAVERDD